jgi:hypothetical protein
MRRICLFVVLAAAWMALSTATASAQLFPGGSRRNSSYDIGAYDAAVGMSALRSSNAAARGMAQTYQAWGQQASSAQMSATQSGIRDAMSADAQQRAQGIYGQQQANRDWWFQAQERQVAQRQAAASQSRSGAATYPSAAPRYAPSAVAANPMSPYVPPPSMMGFESSPDVAPASSGIIKWLPVLSGPEFAQQRARIEAPYLRSSKGLSNPTPEDYRNMIETSAEMKTTLKRMADAISAQDYLSGVAFLDQLAAEARGRLEKTSPKS